MNDSTGCCPHCGAEISLQAKFCRHCGSSDSDGWREEGEFDDFEGDDFDYDEFVRDEFSSTVANTRTRPIWRFVAVALLIVFAAGSLLLLM